ncbi:hypothetical protein BH20ACT16_BH20ACT16_15920 [soil metagenome]
MIDRRARRAIAIGCIAAAGTAGVALAQAPATPAGNFGGGAIAVPVDENTTQKDMLLAIRAVASGRIGVDGQISTPCGQATIRGKTTPAADGSFTLRGNATRKAVVGVTERTAFTVTGTLTADGGTGTAKATVRARGGGRKASTCQSRTVRWTVRRPAEVAAAGPGPGEGTLFGLTAQSGASAKRPIVLHVSNAGRAIDRLVLSFRARCDSRRLVEPSDVNYSPEFDIDADGSFRAVERFRVNYSDVIQRTTVVVSGQFDAAGAVAGQLSVTQRYTNRRNGRRVGDCKTGAQTWSARP